jgi:hypothetical protein
MKNLVNQLINEVNFGDLRGAVASSILYNVDNHVDVEVKRFMEDVYNHGCVSGCVSGMIYYVETIKFYDDNREMIWDLFHALGMEKALDRMEMVASGEMCDDEEELEEFEELYDISLTSEKNELAWMAYELINADLLDELTY